MEQSELDKLKARAEAADKVAPGGWYLLASPWLAPDAETCVLAGNPDPHVAVPVCDMLDLGLAGQEDSFDEDEWAARNDEIAAHIVIAQPKTILALIAEIERLRKSSN
jgi:hypothetical protein